MDFSATQANELITRHGSPLLVISKSRIADNYQSLTRQLPKAAIYYAVKANPHPIVLNTLEELGAGFDVASAGELDLVLEQGISVDRVLYTNPIKPFGAIEYLSRKGIDIFIFDNDIELDKIAASAPGTSVLLRLNVVNPNCVVDLGQKFGCPPDAAEKLLEKARKLGLNPRGLCFHVGSQTSIPQPYIDTILECRNLFNRMALCGHPLDILDIGGGFPISYKNSAMSIEAFCETIRTSLEMYFPDTQILAEPGRFLIGSTATLLARVIGKENRNGVMWYYVEDGLYGSLSGCVFDHAEYRITTTQEGPLQPCVVAGPTCDSFDIISKQEYLPDLAVGDVILVHDVGAYSNASATTFNGYPLTKVVAIS
jgi:ornithine decarboxylase